jgi:hypothetical protein
VCLRVSLPGYLRVSLSVCLPASKSVFSGEICMLQSLSVSLRVSLLLCLKVFLSICLSVQKSSCLSDSLFISVKVCLLHIRGWRSETALLACNYCLWRLLCAERLDRLRRTYKPPRTQQSRLRWVHFHEPNQLPLLCRSRRGSPRRTPASHRLWPWRALQRGCAHHGVLLQHWLQRQ